MCKPHSQSCTGNIILLCKNSLKVYIIRNDHKVKITKIIMLKKLNVVNLTKLYLVGMTKLI